MTKDPMFDDWSCPKCGWNALEKDAVPFKNTGHHSIGTSGAEEWQEWFKCPKCGEVFSCLVR